MKQLNKREKKLALIITALLFLFLFRMLIFQPLRDRLTSTQKNIQYASLLIRKHLDLSRQRDLVIKQYKQIEPYLKLKGSNEEIMAAILTKIEAEARNAGLIISDMKTEAGPKAKSNPKVYRIQLRAEGEINQIIDFIYRMENADILLRLDKVGLAAKDDSGKALKMDATVVGVAVL